MTETTPSTQLTEQALARLRKLATGNGLKPDDIQLTDADEKVYTLQGTLTLMAKCDTQHGRYEGPARGKDRQMVGSIAALKGEVERRSAEFQKGGSWIELCIKELKQHPGQGWGLEGAQITLPEKNVVLAATENCPTCGGQKMITCPQCRGQGTVICIQCQGRREEVCYVCGGSGHNPSDPNQRCPNCQGTRFTPCRVCRGAGQMTCPMCNGRRGTPCPNCRGAGQITEEVGITCGAETHFKMESSGLTTGLRRGLDRLGIVNLSKGHADIELLPPKKEEGDNEKTPPKPIVEYRAKLPYADLKVKFGNSRIALIGAFGKKCALLDVPAFLDTSLEPARAKLREGDLDAALKMRLMHEALALELMRKGNVQELRRLYSVGLSNDAAKEILINLSKALKQRTLSMRTIAAVAFVGSSAALFAGIFLTPAHQQLTQDWTPIAVFGLDLAIFAAQMTMGWVAISFAMRKFMRKRFPELKISLRQRLGAIGYSMLMAVAVIFVAILLLAPAKPLWLLMLMHHP